MKASERLQYVNGMQFFVHTSFSGESRKSIWLTAWKFLHATRILIFGG